MAVHHKICSLPQLLERRAAIAAAGRTVVHCHGCFDIVHPGHIHHLQFAKSLGDVLIVTVSADIQVNKGVNRPLIPDDLRAASLAALECVDHVYVNADPTAVDLLEQLRPDVYVKGREYETNHDPRFLAEQDAVTRHGGRVVFSSGDVIYSSTALIGAMESAAVFDDEKVRRFRREHELNSASIAGVLQRCRGKRMVVVGDYVQDRYIFCDATGVAAEAPVMTLRPLRSEQYDGAAAVIAQHLAGLGADVTLITSLADDAASDEAVARLEGCGVAVRSVLARRQLVTKTRYLVDHAKLFKLDEGGVAPLDSRSLDEMVAYIESATQDVDGVIFADFGFGTITTPLLDRVLAGVRRRVPVITADVSGPQGTLSRFKGVDLLCPTERELRAAMNDFSSGLNAVAYQLLGTTRAKALMVTLGKQGLCLFDQQQMTAADDAWERKLRTAYLPSLGGRAVDPLGCGDALLATASLVLAAGGSLAVAAYIGSMAAALELQQVGNHPITLEQLLTQAGSDANSVRARLAS